MSAFWILRPPSNQVFADESPDQMSEHITCPDYAGHRRGGKRIGELEIVVDPRSVKDFTWTWVSDILISPVVVELFKNYRVTGWQTEPAKVSYRKGIRTKPPELSELIVTGWGGWAAPAAGVQLVESCPACGHKVYSIAEPSRLVDADAWDGSDLFIVWPLPRYRFASDRLARILRQNHVSGVDLIPAPRIPTKRGAHVTPGFLATSMPEHRVRELGPRFGIL
jgi:hypothetical protein